MRTLFVTHKWGLGLPNTGDSVIGPLMIGTFLEWGKGPARIIWTDVSFFESRNVREQIQEARENFKPELVIYTPIAFGRAAVTDVMPEHMHDAGCPVVAMFFDLTQPFVRAPSEQFAAAADLCVGVDSATPIGQRFLPLWPVFPIRPSFTKTIDLCFLGARYGFADRTAALDRLAREGIKVTVWGGTGHDGDTRSLAQYYEALDESLIVLSFSKTGHGLDQVKGRPFEAAAAHCCVVDHRTSTTARFFEPDTEFAAWDDLDDLVRVVKGLLADKDKARQIAARGHAAYRAKWSATQFWDRLAAEVAGLPASHR